MPTIQQIRVDRRCKESTWLNRSASNVTSQGGADGILAKLFETIGSGSKWCAEFGAWDGKRFSNTYSLINDQDWSGVLIEGSASRYKDLLVTYEASTGGQKTACPKEVIQCGANLLLTRRKAQEAADAAMEAFNCIDAAFNSLPSGLRRMQLGEMKVLLIEVMKMPHVAAMAHDVGRKLLGQANVEEPTDSQLMQARKGDGGPPILPAGGGGGGR